jgi:hypothetical protein
MSYVPLVVKKNLQYSSWSSYWPCGAPTALYAASWPCGAPVIIESSVHTIYYSYLQENSTKIMGNFLLNTGKQFSHDLI